MVREERYVKSKLGYKLLILAIKYIPLIITLFYILNVLLYWFNIDTPVISNIAGVSLLTWIVLLLSAIVFKFCIYHRLFLYYILISDLITIYDFYIGIPLNTRTILEIQSILIGILIFSILFIYLKTHDKSNKKLVIKNN